ncbi:DUF975 family protein [Wenyingzhuangia sp. chi5]|uniref:DUF975 family protein n=1 Tax=Wenyingzhuangia gilva TaxID=3057677 RepID=A0ABT8VNL9_9FLAO|nr:DUF975 family protein [Wenyingzhuangia sp. chi5]MDO3693569.1 DUF975 family protein [Wenyingzhuangia sp. chi5]
MTTENTKLMQQARASLDLKWGMAIITFLIYNIIVGSLSIIPILGSIGALILAGPFAYGLATFSMAISRNQKEDIKQIFEGFNNFANCLIAYLLMVLYVILWSLLFIIPGIIAVISYSMVFYIMVDEPEIGPEAALRKSKEMMYGYKWKFFRLNLRFLGWSLLCILTLGIGFLWLIPYMHVTYVKFYEDIKNDPLAEIGSQYSK